MDGAEVCGISEGCTPKRDDEWNESKHVRVGTGRPGSKVCMTSVT
jgi:hypothetical protein